MIIANDRTKPPFLAGWLFFMLAPAVFVWAHGHLLLPGALFPATLTKLLRSDYLGWACVFWGLVAMGQCIVLRDRLPRPWLWFCGTLVGGLLGVDAAIVVDHRLEWFFFRLIGPYPVVGAWPWLQAVVTASHIPGAVLFGLLLAAGQAIASGVDRRFILRWMATLAAGAILLLVVRDTIWILALQLWKVSVAAAQAGDGLHFLLQRNLAWIMEIHVLAGWSAFALLSGVTLKRLLGQAGREQ